MTIKELIKRTPIIGVLLQKLYRKFFHYSKSLQTCQDDWTLRVEKNNTIYGNFFSWKGDTISDQLKQYSAHTRNELAMIRSFIDPGDNIVDVGAHIGTFSIPFHLFAKKQGTIFAFEANPENYNLLRMNIVENDASRFIVPCLAVVSNTSSAFKMFLPDGGNSGMYTFLPVAKHKSNIIANCVNIDTWYRQNHKGVKIHLIKIDVEGAEVSVLEACRGLISEYKPVLYIEINVAALGLFGTTIENIEHILQQYGYHYFRNVGDRNSAHDLFKISRLASLKEGGDFFDVLAIHPDDPKYSRHTSGGPA